MTDARAIAVATLAKYGGRRWPDERGHPYTPAAEAICNLEAALRALLAAEPAKGAGTNNGAAREALARIQWSRREVAENSWGEDEPVFLCPERDQTEARGHAPDCRIGMALAPEPAAPARCDNPCPAAYGGHWRDWHKGHGCDVEARVLAEAASPAPPASDEVREAAEAAYDFIQRITSGPTASIGAIGNAYRPQLDRQRTDALAARILAALRGGAKGGE